MNTVWLAFLTGLTTGGLSCLAVQGGLLASSVASLKGDKGDEGDKRARMNNWLAVGSFLIAKLLAYALLGFALGALGSVLTLSPKLFGTMQILVGLFMLVTAARILNLHPVFRYFVIQPPKWAYRLLKNKSSDASLFGPAILGFLTVLLPCGVTQATMAVAVASGSPWLGASIMGAFVLGTSPIFFALGASMVELLKRPAFSYVAAGVMVIFAVLSINGGMALRGSFYTLQNLYRVAAMSPQELATIHGKIAGVTSGIQEVTMNVTDGGYEASATTLRAGVPVRLTLVTNNTRGCTRAFTIPDMNLTKTLKETGREVVEFTPTKTGRLAYTCGMGMYTGSFAVVN